MQRCGGVSFLQSAQPSPAAVLPSSHCSLPSTILLPQLAMQSLSLLELAPGGQQPSPDMACVIALRVQLMLQVDGLPVVRSAVQLSLSLQSAGQGVLVPFSQVSPVSSTRLPHDAEQSRSLLELQPDGQQRSLLRHCVIGTRSQRRLQVLALPLPRADRHGLLEVQALHDSGGSQVSPVSITRLPHLGAQSVSVVALAPSGQQLSF